MELLDILFKLVLAIALGGLIGLERETSRKPAGFRTNIIVCVSAAMLMALAGLLTGGPDGGGADTMIRMAAGVATGVGFLGAGTIVQARGFVVGLTTASTLWLVAGLGLVIGAGYYLPALIVTALVMLTLVLFGRVEEAFLRKTFHHYNLRVEDSPDVLSKIRRLGFHTGIRLERISLKKEGAYRSVSFSFAATEEKEQEFYHGLLNLGAIEELRID